MIVSIRTAAETSRLTRQSTADEISRQFTEMWTGMDQVFIDNPQVHKYLYPTEEGKPCTLMPAKGTADYELAVCVAEKFRDLFEYAEPIATRVSYDFAYSFNQYMKRMVALPVYQEMNRLNPIDYESKRKIGDLLDCYLEQNKPTRRGTPEAGTGSDR